MPRDKEKSWAYKAFDLMRGAHRPDAEEIQRDHVVDAPGEPLFTKYSVDGDTKLCPHYAGLVSANLNLLKDLVIHEDKHNWQKFYSYIYLNAAFLAAIAFSLRADPSVERSAVVIVVSVAGALVSFGFEVTLNGGVTCLNGHKARLMDYELFMQEELSLPRVLGNRKGPSRRLMLAAPRWGILLWFAIGSVLVGTSLASVGSTPPQPPEHQNDTEGRAGDNPEDAADG